MDANSAPVLTYEHVTSVGDFKYVTEASTIGWRAGEVKQTIPTDIGNKQAFILERTERRDGEVTAWAYRQPFGICRLRVFND